ncbi:hypothetical protein GJ744_001771 [Endocarpon pusillum]|uniref:Uncharacterized protein n=1 Tax=Endocarpon pusillum TaxID=364733 RepID=A0A8H7AGJ6_9EURO|nr:hypothetical protein GJ744_001771 [Endocarpon pusillum]
MDSVKAAEKRSKPKPIPSPISSSDRAPHGTTSSSVSPPMSPSAFSPTSPITASPETRSSRSFSIPLPFQARSITRATTTDSIFRSRSKSPRMPPPTAIDTKSTGSSSPPPNRLARTGSEPTASPTSPNYLTSPSRPSALKRARNTSGSTSHYGRHTNDWLFGGIRVRETVKGIVWKDNDSQDR